MFKSRTHYINHFRNLINQERDADIERMTQEIKTLSGTKRELKGRAFLNMRGSRAGTTFGRQYLIKYMKPPGQALPEHEMQVGDAVIMSEGQPLKKGNPLGTLVDKGKHHIVILTSVHPEKWMLKAGVRIDLYVNDVTYRRMQEALDTLLQGREASSKLMELIIGDKHQYLKSCCRNTNLPDVLGDLRSESGPSPNRFQGEAIRESLAAKHLYVVHGPPGTGKTLTCAKTIQIASRSGASILATAQSNGAVDNLAAALIKLDVKCVRIGQPFRVRNDIQDISLETQITRHESYERVQLFREKAFELIKQQEAFMHPSPRWTRGMNHSDIHRMARKGKGSRGVSASDMKSMSSWIKLREEINGYFEKADALEMDIAQNILKDAQVLLSTNVGAGMEMLEGWNFDLLVMDEATQSTEPAALIPVVKAKKLLLYGDHKQLPPTVISMEAAAGGLSISLLERMVERYKEGIVTMLIEQYRMNQGIMHFPNGAFYEGKLLCAKRNKLWQIELNGKSITGKLDKCILNASKSGEAFMHVEGREKPMGDGPSYYNEAEAEWVIKCVKSLLGMGLLQEQIGIITPYKAQVVHIRERLNLESIQVDTVDGFQGQEKEIIIISLVRSNPSGQLGFLNDLRRLNVSLTRAKKLRLVAGSRHTLESNEVYKAFIEESTQFEKDSY